jgi:hypothetical protein
MKVVERIAMKCTREEYESIKNIIGDLDTTCKDDFILFNYLCNDTRKSCMMYSPNFFDRKVYETFDKDIFLKACGIERPKISVDYNYEKFVSLTREEIETILGYKIKIVK